MYPRRDSVLLLISIASLSRYIYCTHAAKYHIEHTYTSIKIKLKQLFLYSLSIITFVNIYFYTLHFLHFIYHINYLFLHNHLLHQISRIGKVFKYQQESSWHGCKPFSNKYLVSCIKERPRQFVLYPLDVSLQGA